MGPILYERYIKPYTEKQWGRPARTLSAQWAPRRVSVRWDNDPYLFADPLQGWPAGPNGYTDLIDGLLAADLIELRSDVDVDLADVDDRLTHERADVVVLTCPLDVFAGERFGRLDWRGIAVRSIHIPHIEYAQGAMVVNYPGLEYPFIRVHETKHASGQQCEGTVLGFEFTGAPTRYYPIELPENRALNDRYKAYIRDDARRRAHVLRRPAGELRLHRHGRLHAPGAGCRRRADRRPEPWVDQCARILGLSGRQRVRDSRRRRPRCGTMCW